MQDDENSSGGGDDRNYGNGDVEEDDMCLCDSRKIATRKIAIRKTASTGNLRVQLKLAGKNFRTLNYENLGS